MSEPRGIDPKARERVIEIVGDRLTSLFEDYLGENIAAYLLTEYDNGFLVTQLVSDIKEGVGQWATKTLNSETLHNLVYDLCEEYLWDDDE